MKFNSVLPTLTTRPRVGLVVGLIINKLPPSRLTKENLTAKLKPNFFLHTLEPFD